MMTVMKGDGAAVTHLHIPALSRQKTMVRHTSPTPAHTERHTTKHVVWIILRHIELQGGILGGFTIDFCNS